MNSTLKNMLFWVVLIVVGVLIWNFSTKLQQHEHQVTFTDFMTQVDRSEIANVTITGQDITGHTNASEGEVRVIAELAEVLGTAE